MKKEPYRRPYDKLLNEIMVQDSLFRLDFDAEKRNRILPWIVGNRKELVNEESIIMRKFITNEIDFDVALKGIIGLMKKYYEEKL